MRPPPRQGGAARWKFQLLAVLGAAVVLTIFTASVRVSGSDL